MEETLTYDPVTVIITLVVAVVVFTLYIAIIVGIIRWIFRINKIVEVLTDQAVFLEDIKEKLEAIKNDSKPQAI